MDIRSVGRSAGGAFFRAVQSHFVLLLFAAAIFLPRSAAALPSFSVQTNQPCSACHLDTYGPRLNQAGRDFKLHGFTWTDGQSHPVPVSVFAQLSFTHNGSKNTLAESHGYPGNDYFSVDQVDGYFGGKIVDNLGGVAAVSWLPDYGQVRWGPLNLRYARDLHLFGTPLVVGATVSNAPSENDLWDADSMWSSPFVQSRLSKIAQGKPLTEMIAGNVIGAGAYAQWNDTLYVEADEFSALGRNALNLVGAGAVLGTDQLRHWAPYWRVALQHRFSAAHYVELGGYGLSADAYPFSLEFGGANHFEDKALDFTYEWTPEDAPSDALSVRALYLHEDGDLRGSQRLFRAGPAFERLSRFQVKATYTFHSDFTPGLEYFSTTGTRDPVRWHLSATGYPNSSGVVAEFGFVPWGTADSSHWYNARAAIQYTAYTKYNGVTAGASSNNTVFVTLSFAMSPNGVF